MPLSQEVSPFNFWRLSMGIKLLALLFICSSSFAADSSYSPSAVTITGTVSTTPTGMSTVQIVRLAHTSTTTSAYVQLIASTSDVTNKVLIADSSGQSLVIAVGGSGSEVNKFYIPAGGSGSIDLRIPSGSRIAVEAVSGTANSGELLLTLLK